MPRSFVVWAMLGGLAFAGPAAAQDTLAEWIASGGGSTQKEWAPTAARETDAGALTFYSDRGTFDGAFPGTSTEDFEAGNVGAGLSVACPAPLDSTSDNACFTPGQLLDGIRFQDLPGPDGTDGLILLGDGVLGNSTKVLASNTLADRLEIRFPEPVTAAGMDLINVPGAPDTLDIEIYDSADQLLGATTSASSAAGIFWGVSSPDPIARIVLFSANNEAEGIDDLSFFVDASLVFNTLVGADSCATDPAGNNGAWEPGEVVDLTLDLTAVGADFSNIQGTLTTGSPDVVVVDGDSAWPDLLRGQSGSNLDPLRIVLVAPPCGDRIPLGLSLVTDQGSFTVGFSQSVGEDQSPTVPVVVPDGNPTGTVSNLDIATDVSLTQVDVRVDLRHTWVGDLEIRLRSPASTEVTLLDRPGVPSSALGCNNNDVRVTFTDGAAVDPENVCTGSSVDPWVTGDVLPAEALSAFNGESSQGTWTLTVIDHSVGDVGTLEDWELITTPFAGGVCEACVGGSDLEITKVCGEPGIRCALQVTNLGPSVALDVTVTDTIPVPLTWASDTCGAGPPAGNLLTWNVGSLNPGEVASCDVDFTAPFDAVETVVNVADVTSSIADPDPTNNEAMEPISLGNLLVIPTLSVTGLLVLAMILGSTAFWILRRRRELVTVEKRAGRGGSP